MENENQNEAQQNSLTKKLNIIILVLLLLLVGSAGVLVIRSVQSGALSTVYDNLIGEPDSSMDFIDTGDSSSNGANGANAGDTSSNGANGANGANSANAGDSSSNGANGASGADAGDSTSPSSSTTDSTTNPNNSNNDSTSGNTKPNNAKPNNGNNGNGDSNGATTKPSQQDKEHSPLPDIELYKKKSSDNKPFQVRNMVPGDKTKQRFNVRVYHDGAVVLAFRSVVTDQTKELAEVLDVQVRQLDDDYILYNSTFAELQDKVFLEVLPTAKKKQTTRSYEITVSMDTSVGNPYQMAMLMADFEWYITGTGCNGSCEGNCGDNCDCGDSCNCPECPVHGKNKPNNNHQPCKGCKDNNCTTDDCKCGKACTCPDCPIHGKCKGKCKKLKCNCGKDCACPDCPTHNGGKLIPKTGDTNTILLWSAVALVSLILLFFLLKRRKKQPKEREK